MKIKRFIAVCVFLLLLLTFGFACGKQPEEEESVLHDFRAVDWGMDRAAVEKAEGDDFTFASDEMMLYGRAENGDDTILMYEFIEDRLIGAEVAVQMGDGEWSQRVPEMIESYQRQRDRLTDTYGPPLDGDYEVWADPDPDYINDPQMHNLYYGRLKFLSEWTSETTEIRLEMYYENRNFNYILTAVSRED